MKAMLKIEPNHRRHPTGAVLFRPHTRIAGRRGLGALLACAALAASPAWAQQPASPTSPTAVTPGTPAPALQPYTEEIPKAAFKIQMVPIPADPAKKIDAFWMASTELTWDAFDVYVYRLDEEGGGEAVARGTQTATRPTKPYLPPDRGLGHAGFATISISYRNAQTFCDWLSEKTGKHYRLPTEAEWEHAALAGATGDFSFGAEDAADPAAWFLDNSDSRPHPVGKKTASAWGLFDMHGNVWEWVQGPDGKGCIKGGSYLDPIEDLKVTARKTYDPAWNAGDPNIPKSKWWLTDAPFIGFRIVCDPKPRPAAPKAETPAVPAPTSTTPTPAPEPKK